MRSPLTCDCLWPLCALLRARPGARRHGQVARRWIISAQSIGKLAPAHPGTFPLGGCQRYHPGSAACAELFEARNQKGGRHRRDRFGLIEFRRKVDSASSRCVGHAGACVRHDVRATMPSWSIGASRRKWAKCGLSQARRISCQGGWRIIWASAASAVSLRKRASASSRSARRVARGPGDRVKGRDDHGGRQEPSRVSRSLA